MELPEIKTGSVETKSVMTKSNGPLGGYAVNRKEIQLPFRGQ